MKPVKGSRTEKNLLTAFAGESQARNRYTYFAGQARKDGMVQIADMFVETAEQEKEHAKRLFKFLEGGDLEISAAFPAGVIGCTLDNLIASAAGENHEHLSMYPEFARIAQEEGYPEIAAVFKSIAVAEAWHERRFLGFAKNVKDCTVFKRESATAWRCRNCGYVHSNSTTAPEACPACAHPKDYFELLVETW